MKTILVPVDFSPTSENALMYASDLAKHLSARLVIFHAHDLTVDETIPVLPPSEEIEDESIAVLNNLKNIVKERHGDKIDVTVRFSFGLPVDEIEQAARLEKADLIVAGMPDHGFLAERILGSIAANIMLTAPCPVLTVHGNQHFRGLSKIVLAADYQPMPATVIKPLEQLLTAFSAHLFVLNIHRKNNVADPGSQISAGFNLDYELRNLQHSFHDLEDHNVIDGIERFATQNQADLVVILPRRHDWFTHLITGSTTKKAAFNLSVPVLGIHQ